MWSASCLYFIGIFLFFTFKITVIVCARDVFVRAQESTWQSVDVETRGQFCKTGSFLPPLWESLLSYLFLSSEHHFNTKLNLLVFFSFLSCIRILAISQTTVKQSEITNLYRFLLTSVSHFQCNIATGRECLFPLFYILSTQKSACVKPTLRHALCNYARVIY